MDGFLQTKKASRRASQNDDGTRFQKYGPKEKG